VVEVGDLAWREFKGERHVLWVLSDKKTTYAWIRKKVHSNVYEALSPDRRPHDGKAMTEYLLSAGSLIGIYFNVTNAKNACRDFVLAIKNGA